MDRDFADDRPRLRATTAKSGQVRSPRKIPTAGENLLTSCRWRSVFPFEQFNMHLIPISIVQSCVACLPSEFSTSGRFQTLFPRSWKEDRYDFRSRAARKTLATKKALSCHCPRCQSPMPDGRQGAWWQQWPSYPYALPSPRTRLARDRNRANGIYPKPTMDTIDTNGMR